MITVPIRTVPGLNAREHWAVRAKRVKAERETTAWHLKRCDKPTTPCTVVLTRVSPRGVADDDNLAGALKAVRDQVAEWLGVDDKHRHIVRYEYQQRRGPWGVEIAFQHQLQMEEA